MTGIRYLLALLLAVLMLSASIARADSEPSTTTQVPPAREQAAALFDEVWRTVRDEFYDPAMHGLNWSTVASKHRPIALEASDERALAEAINAMLGELGASHLGYFTTLDTAYYELADIFSRGLHQQIKSAFPNGEIAYTGIGIVTRRIEGKVFVFGVFDGMPADQAGLSVGDEIIAADGVPYEPVASFEGKAGAEVTMTIRRTRGGEPQRVSIRPRRIKPNEGFLDAMRASARVIERQGVSIGYVHVWSYARSDYQELLEQLISAGPLKDADALIWDLRDGWGGADPAYLDLFSGRAPTMTTTGRNGHQDVVNARWRKPAAILINGGTRSGKEVLAYGFKKYGFGEIIGTRTSGALLAGRAFLMSNGGLLIVPVSDVSVDGERLEGVGVTPTIEVERDIPYAADADPQLERALDLLARTVGG